VYTLNALARNEGRPRENFFDHLEITCAKGQFARWGDAPAFDTFIEGEWEDWLFGQATDLPSGVDMAFLRPDGTLLLLGTNVETRHVLERPLVDSFKDLSAVFTVKNVRYDPTVESREQGLQKVIRELAPQIVHELAAIENNVKHLTGAEQSSPVKQQHFELLAFAYRLCPKSPRDWDRLKKASKIHLEYRSIRRNVALALESMGLKRDDLPAHLKLPRL
jgi:hypothetical protein